MKMSPFNPIGYNINACGQGCGCGTCSTNNYSNTIGEYMYQPMQGGSPLQVLNGKSPLQVLNGEGDPSFIEKLLGLDKGQALTTVGVSIEPKSVFLLGGVLIGSLFIYENVIKKKK